jgi:probable lipoprotein NlpC
LRRPQTLLDIRRIPPFALLLTCLFLLLADCAGKRPTNRRRTAMQGAIEDYLGTPYRYGGTSRRGIDCSGLVVEIYRSVGVDLPRMSEGQIKAGSRVDLPDLRFGDVLFFSKASRKGGGRTLHVGLYMADGQFVHASKTRGVVLDSLRKEHWRKSFIEARRYLE